MYIYSGNRAEYPKFTVYVRDSFPTLLKVPNVVNALQIWGFMTMPEIRKALEWQEGDVFDTTFVRISENDDYNGDMKALKTTQEILSGSRTVDEVQVSPAAVRAFEDGKGISITGYGLKVYTVGAQMLGQLVINSAANHSWKPGAPVETQRANARQRRAGFFSQVYGGTPRARS